jgi:hypothetical protein
VLVGRGALEARECWMSGNAGREEVLEGRECWQGGDVVREVGLEGR